MVLDATDAILPTSTDTILPDATDTLLPTGTDVILPDATDSLLLIHTNTLLPNGTDILLPTSTDSSSEIMQNSTRTDTVSTNPPEHKSCQLSNLAKEMFSAYQQTGLIDDLHQAIKYGEEAVEATPPDHHHLANHLAALASHLKTRFERAADIDDIYNAITNAERAVKATEDSNRIRFLYVNNLACCFNIKFVRTGDVEDLEQAIAYARDTFAATPHDHQYRPDCLGNLATYLYNLGAYLDRRYQRTQFMEDLERAIGYVQEAVAITPHKGPSQVWYSDIKHESTGDMEHMQQAIEYAQKSLTATQDHDHDRAGRLNCLAIYLTQRYKRTQTMEDLQQAIVCTKEALELTPPGDSVRAHYLNSMAIQYGSRYERTEAPGDLQLAIMYARQALVTIPQGTPAHDLYLNNLASILRGGFKQTGVVEEIQQAILHQAILAATPQTDPARAQRLHSLALYLGSRYSRTGVMADLHDAIEYVRELLTKINENHPKWADSLDALASMLFRRFTRTGSIKDISESIQFYKAAWNCTTSPPSTRISVILRLYRIFHYCPSHGPKGRSIVEKLLYNFLPELSYLLEEAILMLPTVSPRSLERRDQQYMLTELNNLAGDAAYSTLAVGKPAHRALMLLELCRGVTMGFTVNCRGDMSDLRAASPELYHKFNTLRTAIDSSMFERVRNDDETIIPWGKVRAGSRQERERDLVEMENTIRHIRMLPDFERFQLPPTPEELMELAREGPIVVFHSASIRSDAIIITTTSIHSIPLPKLINHEIPGWLGQIGKLAVGTLKNMGARNQKMRRLLHWLWNVAVGPVIQELQLTVGSDPNGADLTHIWWIGVGLLSTAPFHAAGDYSMNADPHRNTMSYVVSSYTPTIKALSFAREKEFTIVDSKPDTKLLLVTMPETPGNPKPRNLPGVNREVSKIIQVTNGVIWTEHMQYPSTKHILDQLQSCSMIHFACHGISNIKDPSNSHLILVKDGEQDWLTVQDIANTNMTAQLAYLSACSTANRPEIKSSNESIHIASGFQLAGFNHVLAAMWPSESVISTEVSTEFYRNLFNGDGSGHRKVRTAFHSAVKRAQGDYRRTPLRWAPFIHLGA